MATAPAPAPAPAPAQAPEPEVVPVGEMREGWRTPMDNPAHPLHHLRNVF